jgi:hypothetical protein
MPASCRKQTFASFDHLVCDQQKIARYRQAEIFSCLEVDNELEFGRNLNWQIIRRRHTSSSRTTASRRRNGGIDYFSGLDVSVKETSVCIVDETGKTIREVKIASGCGLRSMKRPRSC